MDIEMIKKILEQNKKKNFVARMYQQNPQFIDYGNGQVATHKMAWGNINGKNLVFPTILQTDKGLQEFSPQDAVGHVLKTGNFIEFGTPEEADFFSKNYKKALTNPIFQ